MARIFKARTQAVDNNTIGAAVTTQERTLAGATAPVFTATWGNKEKIASGVAYGADENLVAVATNLLSTERRVPVETVTTGASAGIPGSFTPSGAPVIPANFVGLSGIFPSPTTAWLPGQHVVLGDASTASWNGIMWKVGAVATGATAGAPGTFTPAGSAAPGNFTVLTSTLVAMPPTVVANPLTAWTTGQRVVLGDASLAYWNGTAWAVGTAALLMADEESAADEAEPAADEAEPEAPVKRRRRSTHGEE